MDYMNEIINLLMEIEEKNPELKTQTDKIYDIVEKRINELETWESKQNLRNQILFNNIQKAKHELSDSIENIQDSLDALWDI